MDKSVFGTLFLICVRSQRSSAFYIIFGLEAAEATPVVAITPT